jgi:hypothetical protein
MCSQKEINVSSRIGAALMGLVFARTDWMKEKMLGSPHLWKTYFVFLL